MATDTDIVTRVGPGTPMGNLMREYWIPAALSSELVADGPPMRLMLLGEKLIAFRDSFGRVGILDHTCPHRCASLFFGRNEEGGVRCAYHGWKFDVEGNCLDMPNVPPHQAFTEKVKAPAYPTAERAGLVWAYMGKRKEPPPLPAFEAVMLDPAEQMLFAVQRECNYLQALEGDIDTSHFGFLHAGKVTPEEADPTNQGRYALINRAPEYHVADTEWGTMYAAHRPAEPGQTYWRFAHFLFPFWTLPPDGNFADHVVARAWVPMDDTHTMFFHTSWKKNTSGLRKYKDGNPIIGFAMGNKLRPNDTSWFGRWRLEASADNDYLMDRDVQRTGSYTGITGIHLQDQAITESMGGIADHAKEHLALSDLMIARTRRRLAQAVREHAQGGAAPGVDQPELFAGARSGDFISADTVGWLKAYGDEMRASSNPTGVLRIAAE
ncbi:MAG TPA: Rieske 2Fe-2S domain-containing protein [Hyphomicrobiales bacterium]|nr:Rieske 2Fe-2S domain-containing protein [Hyphomicrobiales bacterium]